MENIFYSELSQIFQCLLIKNQEREVGSTNTDANHCGEMHLGRRSFVGGKWGEGVVGLMENIFYSKLNQIFQSLVLNTQDLDKGLMNTDANHCGHCDELHLGRSSIVVVGYLGGRGCGGAHGKYIIQ